MFVRSITQPLNGSTLATIASVFRDEQVSHLDVAAAYITIGGAQDLFSALAVAAGPAWNRVQKRWITSFDYCRTEPLALEEMLRLPRSQVRIHDADNVLAKGCKPTTPFHPKTFIMRAAGYDFVLAGSGNLSKSGLRRGHEAGFLLRADRPQPVPISEAGRACRAYRAWYRALWENAGPATGPRLSSYARQFESRPNLTNPTPTDDDVVPAVTRPGQLTPEQLRKLRVCRHFWIESGNPGQNLGDHRPGNQLMMKRLSRVYFGVQPDDVPRNSPLGQVQISFDGNPPRPCSLTFSDNGMDKLTLPVPGDDGPPDYINKNLLFERIGPGVFELSLGTAAEKAAWKRNSRGIDGWFVMPPGRAPRGREWGVF